MCIRDRILLREALLNDSDLCYTYYELKSSMNLLDSEQLLLSLSNFSIAKIKSYARGFSSKPSKYIDRIDLVLN